MKLTLCALLMCVPLAGAQDTPQNTKVPLAINLEVGRGSWQIPDPFTPEGLRATTNTTLQAGAWFRADTWYAETEVAYLSDSATGHTMTAATGHQLLTIGPVRFGLGADYAQTQFENPVFAIEQTRISTRRVSRTALFNLDFRVGPYNRANARVALIYGFNASVYSSVFRVPGFEGVEVLANDQSSFKEQEGALTGLRVSLDSTPLNGKIRLSASARYLRLLTGHSPWIPDSELTGSLGASVRVLSYRRHGLYVGALARLAPHPRPSITTDRSVNLHLAWRHQ